MKHADRLIGFDRMLMLFNLINTGLFAAGAMLGPSGDGQQPIDKVAQVPTTPPATPRVYQQNNTPSDIFARMVTVNLAVARLPKTNVARRAAMVRDIRRNVMAVGSTFDMAELDRVLDVVGAIEREKFVSKAAQNYAYIPFPLQIGYDQTISDSYIVAVMTAAVRPRPGQRVLDVGTGSGYQAAVVSRLVGSVASIEIVDPLAKMARKRLKHLGYRNVDVITGDGFGGVPDRAPFDSIIVAAGAKTIPKPLIDQLKIGGRLVMPIGPATFAEHLVLLTKLPDGSVSLCSMGPAAFVPFTGRAEADKSSQDADPLEMPSCFGQPVT